MNRLKFVILFLFFLVLTVGEVEANLVLKVIVVNPSKEQTQKFPVKTYLPQEAKPEDIIDMGDLEAAYDTQQQCYFVYGEYELKPGEILEREIELRDIWIIQNTEIESISKDLVKLSDLLIGTEFSKRFIFLKDGIESKIKQITESQKNMPSNPELLISNYRENLKILETIKADLALARSFLALLRPFPVATIWRLILVIVIFLGILGAGCYIIWQKQIKTLAPHETSFTTEDKEQKPK